MSLTKVPRLRPTTFLFQRIGHGAKCRGRVARGEALGTANGKGKNFKDFHAISRLQSTSLNRYAYVRSSLFD